MKYVAVDSQRRQRGSDEYEQTDSRRGQALAPVSRTQEGVDRNSRLGVTHIGIGVHGVASGSGSGITVRQR